MASRGNEETRFAHTHILGGSGHGKTQLLQTLIHQDLTSKSSRPPSVVIIDSQGDLIDTISHLKEFDPNVPGSLSDRLLFIDPTDIEMPPAINLFDVNLERIAQYGAVEKERIFNGTIELYEYFFTALLGAGLSQKQNLIFRYLAQLMLNIKGANIHTLRELLEEPEKFQGEIARLDGTARLFFERQFFHKSFDDTRTQVSRRLWGVLANRSFERIFSSRTSRIDLFEAMNEGKIILINTSKDLLKQEGATIFGRFFIAMIAQAALERAQIPRDQRRATYVVIDEAQDYFDESIDQMLEQVRKYKIGITLAHQTLAQLTPKLKASIMANTGTKLVGGLSGTDAATMAKEMGCKPEFLQSMRKTTKTTSFALWVKNQMARPREITIKLGAIDALERMDDESYERLMVLNREKYCLPSELLEIIDKDTATVEDDEPTQVEIVQPVPGSQTAIPAHTVPNEPEAPIAQVSMQTEHSREPIPVYQPSATENRSKPDTAMSQRQGHKRHKQIQTLIRKAAQARGYLSTIEAPTSDGKGRIDVLLKRDDLTIACEVTVTTKAEHELGNIKKCLAEDVDHVAVVSASAKQLAAIKDLVQELSDEAQAKMLFVSPQELLDFLDQCDADSASQTETNRGYKVSVKRFASSQVEGERYREQITGSIARGLVKERIIVRDKN